MNVFEDMDKFESFDLQSGRIKLRIFDFDGTLFNSPIPSRELWGNKLHGKLMNEIQRGGYGWFQNTITLDAKYVVNSDFNEDVTLFIGNTTVNALANSTSLALANSTASIRLSLASFRNLESGRCAPVKITGLLRLRSENERAAAV